MNNKKSLPISEYQKRFFLEWVLSPNSSTYNVSMVYKITGSLDKILLKHSCQIFIDKHDIVHAQYNQDGTFCYHASLAIDDIYHEGTLSDKEDKIGRASCRERV